METNIVHNYYDILFTANKKYIDIMLSSILSLLLNSNLENIRLHIICEGFSIEDSKRVEELIKSFSDVSLYFYPIENYDISKYNIPNWHGSQIANARLFFVDIIKPYLLNIENLLYLDADTIIVGDLNELASYRDYLYAVKDICLKKFFMPLNISKYFNSGVMFINVKEWENLEYQDRIIKFLRNNQIPLVCPDQDVINCALKDNIHELPINYNLPPHAYFFNKILFKAYFNSKYRNVSFEEIEKAKKDPKIMHTYAFLKNPWDENSFNPYANEYQKYMMQINKVFIPEQLDKLTALKIKSALIYKAILFENMYSNENVHNKTKSLFLNILQYKNK